MTDATDQEKLLDMVRKAWLTEMRSDLPVYFMCDWSNAKIYSKYRSQVLDTLDLGSEAKSIVTLVRFLADLDTSGKFREFTKTHLENIAAFETPVIPKDWHAAHEDHHVFWDASDGGAGIFIYEKLGSGLHITLYALSEGVFRATTRTPRCLWTSIDEVKEYSTEFSGKSIQEACQAAYDWAVTVTGLEDRVLAGS